MKIELGKQYQTRDGRKVRILCVDAPDKFYPVVALVGNDVSRYTDNGCGVYPSPDHEKLVPVPQKITMYANVLSHQKNDGAAGWLYYSEKDAREWRNSTADLAIAIPVEITLPEGT